MNKNRMDALSDGVFAIVMTLLVIELHLPESAENLWASLAHLTPTLLAYGISFAVLNMFWVSHNALFHIFTKNINRVMIQLNMLYLALMSLIPFSAHVLGSRMHDPAATAIYGANVFLLALVNYGMLRYALVSDEIDTAHVSQRTIKQATIRMALTPISTVLGIAMAFLSLPIAWLFFAFPIVFNIIPGTLDGVEKLFGLNFDEKKKEKKG